MDCLSGTMRLNRSRPVERVRVGGFVCSSIANLTSENGEEIRRLRCQHDGAIRIPAVHANLWKTYVQQAGSVNTLRIGWVLQQDLNILTVHNVADIET